MFTGIVERPCRLLSVDPGPEGAVQRLVVDLAPLRDLPDHDPSTGQGALAEPGASVAIDGVCLTVVALEGDRACFDVIEETMVRTALGDRRPGDRLNVERALRFGERLDGHLVQGHVEGTGTVTATEAQPGQRWVEIEVGPDFARRTLPKGSVTLDGVSLTVAELRERHLAVALVPHTLELTTLGERQVGDHINLEADVIGQWVLRLTAQQLER